jgi:MFS family permease
VAVVAGVWVGVLATIGKEALQRQSFIWWVTNRLMYFAAITSIQGFAPFFLMYAFGVDEKIATSMTGQLLAVVGIFTLISALPSGWLSDRIGQRRIVNFSGILAAIGTTVVLSTIWMPDLTLIYIAGSTLGISAGFFVTTNWALGTRLVPADQAGRYLGVSNLAGAGAGMVGAGIGGVIADNLNASYSGLGYFAIFASYAVMFLLSNALLLGVREKQS